MTSFTRITVVGSARRATLVVAAEEPVGALVPDIADLLQEPATAGGGTLTLVDSLGNELELEGSSEEQGLKDGQVLYLLPAEDAPAPPEVSDVTDVVAETLDRATTRWNAAHRETAGAIALGVLALAATAVPTLDGSSSLSGPVAYTLAVVAAVALGLGGLRWAGVAATAVAVGTALPAAWFVTGPIQPLPSPTSLGGVAVLSGLVWIALGVGLGVGRRDRAPLVGMATGVFLTIITLALSTLGIPQLGVAAVLAVLVAASLGLLPALALNASQVTTLDDLVIAGRLSARTTVIDRITSAYSVFGWAAYALAAFGAVTIATLVASQDVWPTLLGTALALVLVLRTRVMPMAWQVWPLWIAGIGGVGAALAARPGVPAWMLAVAAALAAVAVIVLVMARPRPHTRVQLRRLGDLVEALAVLAMVPAVLGVFDVYAEILGMFS